MSPDLEKRVPRELLEELIEAGTEALTGCASLVAPLRDRRARVYFMYPKETGRRRLSGDAQVKEFLDCCRQAAMPDEWLEGARPAGPLAEFNGADHWVEHPAGDGVVLIGDAAAASDPDWGSGLSLTLLDVLRLSESLDSTDDWSAAIHRYAEEHDRHYGALHEVTQMWADLIWSPGEAADLQPKFRFRRDGISLFIPTTYKGRTQALKSLADWGLEVSIPCSRHLGDNRVLKPQNPIRTGIPAGSKWIRTPFGN